MASPAARGGVDMAPDSPRAALRDYLELCRQGRFAEAAGYLGVSAERRAEAPEMARRLKAVLDRHLWIDLDRVSPLSEGDEEDGLARDIEHIGAIASADGRSAPVRLVRQEGPEGLQWVFSRATVERIDGWYRALGDLWLQEHLPAVLLRPGPRELLWWQWLAFPLVLALSWMLGRILAWVTRAVLERALARTRLQNAVLQLRGPLTLAWTLAAFYALLPSLALYAPAAAFAKGLLGAGAVVALSWAFWRGVDALGRGLQLSWGGRDNPSAQSLLSIAVRAAKVLVLAMGTVAFLAQVGYPVGGLLAGLGIGGLALALAAQKTVENLFGSVSLAVDRPFAIGDFVKVEEFVGTVEAIGLRSTRIRTLDRTLITIPNGRLADMRLESLTARDRMRLACTVGLVYGTTAVQMHAVLQGLEKALRSQPRIWPDAVVVRFKEFGASSLDIEVMAWFQTSEWSEFQRIRQDVLLAFMGVVEQAGTSFAFPTRTVHLADASPAEAQGRGESRAGAEVERGA